MTIPTPDAMVEELEGAARDLRACANKKKDAVESLTGFSLDAIAIYTGNAAELIQQQRGEIERLFAALERAIEAIQEERDCTVECATVGPAHDLSTLDPGAKPYVEEYDAMLAYLRAALGKDASNVRSQREGRGQ